MDQADPIAQIGQRDDGALEHRRGMIDQHGVRFGSIGEDGARQEPVAASQVEDARRRAEEVADDFAQKPDLLRPMRDRRPNLIEEPMGDSWGLPTGRHGWGCSGAGYGSV